MVPDCGDKRDVKALAYTTAYVSPNFFIEFFVSNGGSKSDLFLLGYGDKSDVKAFDYTTAFAPNCFHFSTVCAFPDATGYGKVPNSTGNGKVFYHLFDFRNYIIRLLFSYDIIRLVFTDFSI